MNPAVNALLVGGFEPSGHDSLTEALAETGRRRGNRVQVWSWADWLEALDHPIFHLHRLGAEAAEPELALLMDDARLSAALASDLRGLLPLGEFDLVISAHPWSTLICAEEMKVLGGERPMLLDCHGEFTPFPIPLLTHLGVDAFVGGVLPAAAPPRERMRIWSTGVPVREPFLSPSESVDRDGVAINAGHGGWAIDAAAGIARELMAQHRISRATVFAADPDAKSKWCDALAPFDSVSFASFTEEIRTALNRARCLVTKASGSAVAEGLAMQCPLLCFASGVFWEDEARAHLAAMGVAHPVEPRTPISAAAMETTSPAAHLGAICRAAADSIWEIAEKGCPEHRRVESGVIEIVRRRLGGDSRLTASDQVVCELLAEWTMQHEP